MPVALCQLRRALASENPIAEIRALVAPRPPPLAREARPQAALWVVDAEGLPPRPWRVYRDTEIRCIALRCTLLAGVCVARQAASEAQRPRHLHNGKTDTRRGEASDYPSCDTRRCAQGRGIREALDPTVHVAWRGTGPNGRFERGPNDLGAQFAARQRLERVGLGTGVPSCDEPPNEGEE